MPEWKCEREGCPYKHKWKKEGSTSHCCRACKLGESWHSRNCRGYGYHIVSDSNVADRSSPGPEAKRGVASNSRERSREHRGPGLFATTFLMPYSKTRFHFCQTTIVAVEALANVYGHVLSSDVHAAWKRTELVIDRMATSQVNLRVYVYKLEDIPFTMAGNCIDVHSTYPLDAHSASYNMSDVTGANPVVQAHLVTQAATAKAIEEAIIRVELQRSVAVRSIAFACTGGTHRSMGCGCLLLSLVYPRAIIVPCTPRTRIDMHTWLAPRDMEAGDLLEERDLLRVCP